jgi:hypothetical protein
MREGKKTRERKEREKSEIREDGRSRRIGPQACEASDPHPWCL